jgi:hypothetical protein
MSHKDGKGNGEIARGVPEKRQAIDYAETRALHQRTPSKASKKHVSGKWRI